MKMDVLIQEQLIRATFRFVLKIVIMVVSLIGLKHVRFFPVSILISLVFGISAILTTISTIELFKLTLMLV